MRERGRKRARESERELERMRERASKKERERARERERAVLDAAGKLVAVKVFCALDLICIRSTGFSTELEHCNSGRGLKEAKMCMKCGCKVGGPTQA